MGSSAASGIDMPEEWELDGFFEVEPILTDRDVPRYYNQLKYITHRGEEEITFIIEPGYSAISVHWSRNGTKLVDVVTGHVAGIRVLSERGRELLKVTFHESTDYYPLILQLKPSIYVSWGTETLI